MGFKTNNWSPNRENRREGEKRGGKERRRGRGREEEEKPSSKRYGTMTFSMDSCFGLYVSNLRVKNFLFGI